LLAFNETLDLHKYTFLTLEKRTFILKILRQRIQSSTLSGLEENFGYVKNCFNMIMFGNLILNILFSSSLQVLWGTINTLQLLVLVTLFNLSYPYTAIFTFKLIAEISSFKIFPVDKIINMLFSFSEPNVDFSYNFEVMGYDSTNNL
jgi:hypothetical protein